jgi:hypothetical protein
MPFCADLQKQEPLYMVRRTFIFCLYAFLLALFVTCVNVSLAPAMKAWARSRPTLALNLPQGPLGVTLTLKGKNFHPGQAGLSYIDAQNVPGVFVAPSDTNVQVQNDGTFVSSNIILPATGPIGDWKILVTDSAEMMQAIRYTVLAAPGQQTAGTPSLMLNPSSGASGDAIAFTGSNWLPQRTNVNLVLLVGSSSIPLLEPSPASDGNGMIAGSFHLPSNLSNAQATVFATDAATGALRAQAQILIADGTPAPTVSPSPQVSATPSATATPVPSATTAPSPVSTPSPVTPLAGGSNNSGSSSSGLDAAMLGPILLLVGAVLGIAGLILVLFVLPWEERKANG